MKSNLEFESRRKFLQSVAETAGIAMLLPAISSCSSARDGQSIRGQSDQSAHDNGLYLPPKRPVGWNPIEFNKQRGLAGAIPESYLANIQGPDGPLLHIGKHIPYLAPISKATAAVGYLALMVGDQSKGHAQHPQAATHWYDWMKVAKDGETGQEITSNFSAWPNSDKYMVLGGGTIEDNSGKNTIYLVGLPPNLRPGDTIRIIGHCNLHGEYVDFITV